MMQVLVTFFSTLFLLGCTTSYEHHTALSTQVEYPIDGGVIYAQLHPVAGQSIRKVTSPWLLTLTLEFDDYVENVALNSARLLKATGEIVNFPISEPVLAQVHGKTRTIVVAPELAYDPTDGEAFDIEVRLLINKKENTVDVHQIFSFKFKIIRGREKMNPLLDVT